MGAEPKFQAEGINCYIKAIRGVHSHPINHQIQPCTIEDSEPQPFFNLPSFFNLML
jgi:hypothetical protein